MKNLALVATIFASLFYSQSIFADDIPFRQQRREVFRVTPVKEGETVFLGNSITNFGVWPEMFGEDANIVNRGISGIGSAEVAQHIDLIAQGKPSKLFIMLGINDFETPEVVVPSLRKIVNVFNEVSPQTKIYIQSVLPCNLAVRKAVVAPMNEKIKALCSELDIPYIDIYSLLADNGNPKGMVAGYTNDNLHVLASGYRVWTKALEEYIGRQTTWSDGGNITVNGLSTISNIRLSQYGMLPVNDGDILMLGDYNVMTTEWQELLNNPKVKNRGFGQAWGYTLSIDHLAKVVPTVIKGNPASVFVECGIKDLDTRSTNTTSLWNKYQAVIEDILNRAPQTVVYVQSVIPSAYAENNTASVIPFNNMMKAYAEATERVEFIDLYSALADPATGSLASKYVGANTEQSHGVNGRAYLRWANLIAPYIPGSTALPELSDEEFARNEAIYEAYAAIRSAEGNTAPGGKPQDAVEELKAALETALNGGNIDDLNTAISKFNAAIILPDVSNQFATYWYKISTPLRGNTYINDNNGSLNSIVASTAYSQQWKFAERPDGTFDIINRASGKYITPNVAYNQPVKLTTKTPASGWTLSTAATSGLVVITSGTAQLNRNPEAIIVNWGNGNNLTDVGCQFKIELAEKVDIPQSDIQQINRQHTDSEVSYDIHGRKTHAKSRGLIITSEGKKFIAN